MKICACHIDGFGKFTDADFTFSEGVNMISGANESGKSTLQAFFRAMLFGMRRKRGRAARTDDYSRYLPWAGTLRYGGSITLDCGGKLFLLKRDFISQEAELRCLNDNEEMDVENGDLDVLLGEIGEAAYEEILSLGQMKETNPDLILELLRERQAGYAKENGSRKLEQIRQVLLQKRRTARLAYETRESELDKERIQAEGRRNAALNNMKKFAAQMEAYGRDADQKRKQSKEKEAAVRKDKASVKSRVLMCLLFCVAFALLMTALKGMLWGVGSFALLFVLLMYVQSLAEAGQRREANENQASPDRMEEAAGYADTLRFLKEQYEEWKREAEKAEEYREMLGHDKRLGELYREKEAAELALSAFDAAAEEFHRDSGGDLMERAGSILSELTDRKYTAFTYGEDGLSLQREEEPVSVPLYQLSRGTQEQVHFAVRMAASDLICREEVLPVVLDEPFAAYDEERLSAALRFLSGCGRQVFLFSCQKREAEQMGKSRQIDL